MSLSANRNTDQMGDRAIADHLNFPVETDTHIYQGSLVGINAAGNVTKAAHPVPAGGMLIVGRASKEADNSTGAAGALTLDVVQGIFKWTNYAADLITIADVGQACYAYDDATVARTDSAGTQAYAGKVVFVDTDGVWVETRVTSKGAGKSILSFQLDLASITAATIISFKPGFEGRISRMEFVVNVPATTSGKAATLTPKIGGTAVTGGVIALTSADATPMGNNVAGTTVTAANQFGAQDAITVVASAVTAFAEGSGTLLIYLE